MEVDIVNVFDCPTCNGMGSFTIGDVEDGVDELCPECDGKGTVDYDPDNTDEFIPERDALTPHD
jgi:DnaJ-class molecular chaperone